MAFRSATLPLILTFVAFLPATLFLSGCSGSAPEILYPEAELVRVDDLDSGTRYEAVRFFVSVRDDDGIDDLVRVYVDHADAQLYWELDSQMWVQTGIGADHWVGVSELRMPRDEPFPRGRYRVVIEDKAYQRAQGEFSITTPQWDLEQVDFPVSRAGRGSRLWPMNR